MIGGFGMVAYPAQYGSSGVMTFVVNHDGVVYEKDLGPKTAQTGCVNDQIQSRQILEGRRKDSLKVDRGLCPSSGGWSVMRRKKT